MYGIKLKVNFQKIVCAQYIWQIVNT